MENTEKKGSRWIVAAFDGDAIAYYVSITYDDKESAEDFCAKCNEECSCVTRKTYKVVEI